jgi:LPPG:FO 2-phospho-L-lactate transferase
MIAVLAGGVGAARFLRGLAPVAGMDSVTAIVNVADDFSLHGLWICPDLDTVRYTLAEDVGEHGWGRANDTTNAMDELARLALSAPAHSRATDWFALGDKDLATHLYRTQRRAEGASLTRITAELCEATNVHTRLLPVTDDVVQTVVELASGEQVSFQQYFVEMRHEPMINGISFDGIEHAKPGPDVIETLTRSERIFIAPSNPFVSIAPILGVPDVADVVMRRREHVIAISPIVGGRAIKGPAADMLTHLGHDRSVASIARLWAPYAATLVIDIADRSHANEVEAQGMRCVTTDTVMRDVEIARSLAADVMHIPLP